MTKIFICSDIHTVFHADGGKSAIKSLASDDVDIAVVAGDLSTVDDIETSLNRLCDKYPNVVFVSGNHEYYGATFQHVDDSIRDVESKLSNLTFLSDDRTNIDGVNFIGATLWFAMSGAAKQHKACLNDFRYILHCDPIAFDRYNQTVKYLYANIEEGDIVVTHHLPSYQSIGPQYVGSPLNCYFANNLDSLIIDKKPKMWIHGHTHVACDYMIEDTRVICNPLGYPAEQSYFNDSLIVEV